MVRSDGWRVRATRLSLIGHPSFSQMATTRMRLEMGVQKIHPKMDVQKAQKTLVVHSPESMVRLQ